MCGNFLGKDDEWKNDHNKVFVDEEGILKLFQEFDIVKLEENKFYKDSLKTKNKYWHVYNLIAKKRGN